MQITEVRLFPGPPAEPRLKAFATITIDGCFVVRELRIIEGTSGLFVAMPSKRMADGSYKDLAHPINPETRAYVERVILQEYARVRASGPVSPSETPRAEGGSEA